MSLAVATDFFHLAIARLNVARHEARKIHRAFQRQFHNGLVKLHIGGFDEFRHRIGASLLDHRRQSALSPSEFMDFKAHAHKRPLAKHTDFG